MKQLLFMLALVAVMYNQGQAQTQEEDLIKQKPAGVDLQINPIAFLFKALQLSIEFPVSYNGGIEADLVAAEDLFGLIGIGKYYMNPKFGADRFFIGAFGGAFLDEGGAIGFIAGYKFISKDGVNAELSLGIGRGGEDFEGIPYGKISIGYRFGGKK